MSYMRTLDEILSEELVKELHRRHYLRMSAHKCPYCEKPLTSDGIQKLKKGEKPARCSCRFGNVDEYHPPHILNSLQYGD